MIGRARVLLHWDQAGSEVGLKDNVGIPDDLTVFTNADGMFSAEVPPGFYDVFVTSTSFTPIAEKARVKTGASSLLEVKMSVDPLVVKELRDKFSK